MNDRERALRILERVETKKLAVPDAIAKETGIEHPDFIRTLVLGVIRWQARLDHAIATLAGRPTRKIDPIVLRILRLGSFQIWFTEVPAYACVSESTALAGRLAPRAKSFVNAVLRRASERTVESLDPAGESVSAAAVRTSHPEWLLARWSRAFGLERASAIASADQELSWPDLLVNVNRWSPEEAAAEIRSRGLEVAPSPYVPGVLRLRSGTSPLSDLVRDGKLHPMDEGSVAVASLVPDRARSVLDICAAPGGKSLALALARHDVVSCDVSLARLAPLRGFASRMSGRPPRLCVTDALQPAFRSTWDAVLVDAPCSATGTIRKNPEVRWRVSDEEIAAMSLLQKRILHAALQLSRRYVLYATCSLEPEENDLVVDEVLATNDDFDRCPLDRFTPLSLTRWLDSGVFRLTPDSGADGFTATLLERVRG